MKDFCNDESKNVTGFGLLAYTMHVTSGKQDDRQELGSGGDTKHPMTDSHISASHPWKARYLYLNYCPNTTPSLREHFSCLMGLTHAGTRAQ